MSMPEYDADERGSSWRGAPLVVDEEPRVFWERENARTQIRFLNNIDPSYFGYLARVHLVELKGGDPLLAATALRTAYAHALESMFALIGASIQTPKCPAGWLLSYQVKGLRSLIGKVHNRESYLSWWDFDASGWAEVATRLVPKEASVELDRSLDEATTQLWHALATNFLEEATNHEYNSLKHGLRARPGEFRLNMETANPDVQTVAEARMVEVAYAPYGSHFFRANYVKRYTWTYGDQFVSWNPTLLAAQIRLMVLSMQNLLTFLRTINDAPSTPIQHFDTNAVGAAFLDTSHTSNARFHISPMAEAKHFPDKTPQEILRHFRRSGNK